MPLRVLIVGNESDETSILAAMRRCGFSPTAHRVRTQATFDSALSPDFDLILIDHDLAHFDSLMALSILGERRLDAPAVVIAQGATDDLAVKLISLGASDCICKDNLSRLAPAITAALRLRTLRAAQRDASLSLQESERRYRLLIDSSPVGLILSDAAGNCLYANQHWQQLTGFTAMQARGRGWLQAIHPEDRDRTSERWEAFVQCGVSFRSQYRVQTPQGHVSMVVGDAIAELDEQGHTVGSIRTITDVTEETNSEERARRIADVQLGILNALPATIALLNHEGTILSVNDPWRTFSSSNDGDDAHTGIGVNYFKACGEESRDVVAGIREVIENRATFFEKEYPCHSPTQNRWFHLMVRPLPLPEGPGAVVMHIDITERYLAAEALARGEQRYRSLVQANSSIVWSTDADGSVTHEIPLWQEVTGQTFEQYRGAGWLRAVHPDDVDRVTEVWTDCVTNRLPLEIEYRMRIASGGYRDFFVKGVPVTDADGRVCEWVGTHCDITDRKRSEEFERERNHLRDSLTAHERVLGVVGHELRTPLAATRAMTECLLLADRPTLTPQEELVRSIHEQVLKMSAMLHDLLEIAEMNSGTARWNWGTVDVARACADAIETIRAGVNPPRVELILSLDPQDIIMRGDAEAIRRLVLNLVGNACKFTDKGSVNIRVTAVNESGLDWVQIEVIDTGVGMPESVACRVGEPFALSAGVTGNDHIDGAGLGLPICRGIAAAHGGRIWLQSQVGVGTHITVRLRPDLAEPSAVDYAGEFIRQRGAILER